MLPALGLISDRKCRLSVPGLRPFEIVFAAMPLCI